MAPNGKKRRNPASTDAGVQKTRKKQRFVGTNDLDWKPVSVPSMVGDDAEGFLGLEEVTGVEVVKEGNTIKFAIPDTNPTKAMGKGNSKDEWDGFSGDEPEKATKPKKTESKTAEKPRKRKLAEKVISKTSEEKPKKTESKTAEKPRERKLAEKVVSKTSEEKPKKTKRIKEAHEEPDKLDSALVASVTTKDDAGVDVSAWASLGLSPALLCCVQKLGFTTPTEIQSGSIRQILAGHDVVGTASTGSGKTLAFAIPIVQKWVLESQEKAQNNDGKWNFQGPIALIMSPTRALAHQISEHIINLHKSLEDAAPNVCCITGGLSEEKQRRQLKTADIIVCTPGRIWELASTDDTLLNKLKGISFLVIDEADRLLSDGHFKDAKDIIAALDKVETTVDYDTTATKTQPKPTLHPRQTLAFSATFNRDLSRKLSSKKAVGWDELTGQDEALKHIHKRLNFREELPKFIDANPISHLAKNLTEGLLQCGNMERDLYLYALLLLLPSRRTIVFTNAINSVTRLMPMLQNLELSVGQLHSQMGSAAQLRAVEAFKADAKTEKNGGSKNQPSGTASPRHGNILVATDIAARGLDIQGVDMIIHYHVPLTSDAYVHRSGRTARAGQKGLSVLLCSPTEAGLVQTIMSQVHGKNAKIGQNKNGKGGDATHFLRRVGPDRRLITHLKTRVETAKDITDHFTLKNQEKHSDEKFKEWAEDLGTEYEPEKLKGKGSGRAQREEKLRKLTKQEVRRLRYQLRQEVNNPGSDLLKLLREGKSDFLGQMGK